jgi:hypothetical protein
LGDGRILERIEYGWNGSEWTPGGVKTQKVAIPALVCKYCGKPTDNGEDFHLPCINKKDDVEKWKERFRRKK